MLKQIAKKTFNKVALPIVTGPLKGFYWLPSSGGNVVRMFTGTYEAEETGYIKSSLKKGDVLLDIGACHGYYSLLGSRLVGASGKVFAVEADSDNARYLSRHIKLNNVKNVYDHACALGEKNGVLSFKKGTGTGTGKLAENGETEVEVKTMDSFVKEVGVTPTHIKMDVEGAELGVLKGGEETLSKFHPSIFLSTHGDAIKKHCMDYLAGLGYQFKPMTGDMHSTSEILCTYASKN